MKQKGKMEAPLGIIEEVDFVYYHGLDLFKARFAAGQHHVKGLRGGDEHVRLGSSRKLIAIAVPNGEAESEAVHYWPEAAGDVVDEGLGGTDVEEKGTVFANRFDPATADERHDDGFGFPGAGSRGENDVAPSKERFEGGLLSGVQPGEAPIEEGGYAGMQLVLGGHSPSMASSRALTTSRMVWRARS
jgi:hypothetical protein